MTPQVVTEEWIRQASDDQAFERGRVYFAQGRVGDLAVTATGATATVAGSDSYEVTLRLSGTGFTGGCTCPQGAEDAFCKHCAATALAWLAEAGPLTPPESPEKITDDRLKDFLTGRDPAWLAEELIRAARDSRLLRARLEVAAGAAAEDAVDVEDLRHRLTQGIKLVCAASYDDIHERYDDVEALLNEVADLVPAGFAPIAAVLAENALDLLALRDEEVDYFTDRVDDLSASAWRVHRTACAGGHPDPVALADRLLAWVELEDEFTLERVLHRGGFVNAPSHYAEALGTAGKARYRERLEQAWRDLSSSGRARKAPSAAVETIKQLRRRLAEDEGGADALIALVGEEPSIRDVLRIVRALVAEERYSEALDRVRDALERFGDAEPRAQRFVSTGDFREDVGTLFPAARLRELGAQCLVSLGDRREAVGMLFPAFIAHPSLEGYQALVDAAADHWPRWRQRALDLLRDQAGEPGREGDFETLTEILLWESDVEGAWQVARDHTVTGELLLRTARERAATHPADAIPALLRLADEEITDKTKRRRGGYSRAAYLLAEAQVLAERSGGLEGFQRHMAALRAAHKAKSALRVCLDQAGLP